MRLWVPFAASAFQLCVSQEAAALEQWTPSQRDIADLEKLATMPQRSPKPLMSYRRFYSGTFRDRKRLVVGILLAFEPSGIEIVKFEDLPVIFDGGCSIIHVEFVVDTKSFASISCNGEA